MTYSAGSLLRQIKNKYKRLTKITEKKQKVSAVARKALRCQNNFDEAKPNNFCASNCRLSLKKLFASKQFVGYWILRNTFAAFSLLSKFY